MTHARPDCEHYSSHADLLQPARLGQLPLDAIVVPAARSADNLDLALRLGSDLDVQVVVLCSRRARAGDVLDRADDTGSRCTAVDLSAPASAELLPKFETSAYEDAKIPWHGDLSLKRNLGLVMGRMCGWTTLLFLDDDIRELTPTLTRRAVGTLRHHAAAGVPATDFPDNSVVCHARRLAGSDQGVFVSGSALAVNLARVDTFFPEIYNEDWLFLAPYLHRREVAGLGSVRQEEHNPYREPNRAGDEEFGEVIGEGLVGQLHTGPPDPTLSRDYWTEFLRLRSDVIASAAFGCRVSGHPAASRAAEPLRLAEAARARLSPAVLVEYLADWWADRTTWRRYLSRIAPRDDLPTALDRLGLPATTVGPVPARKTGSG